MRTCSNQVRFFLKHKLFKLASIFPTRSYISMNKIFLVLSVIIIIALVALFVFKPKDQPTTDAVAASGQTTPVTSAQTSTGQPELTSSHVSTHPSNTPSTTNQAAMEPAQANLPPDTKSDMSIQPIDPETDPANQVVQP